MITASPGEVTDKDELHGRYFLCRSCEQWEKCNYHETENLVNDVKKVYHDEFDRVLKKYNDKQIRKDRKISD